MTRSISNFDDVIDSRDVIARIEELEGERDGLTDALDEAKADPDMVSDAGEPDAIEVAEEATMDAIAALASWDEENEAELTTLKALAAEGEGCADWHHGEALVRDSYFRDYAQELAEDCAPFQSKSKEAELLNSWPYRCIDWDQAARELRMDYSAIEFGDVTYWVHS